LDRSLGPVAEGDSDMGKGIAIIFVAIAVTNLTNYVVAVYVGSRYVKSAQHEVLRYVTRAGSISLLALVLNSVLPSPLMLANSLIAALIATFTMPDAARASATES